MEETQLLISKDEFKKYKKVSGNLTPDQINPFILDAQEFELRPFLGDELYIDLLDNFTDEKYQELLDGKVFLYPIGSQRKHRFTGLKSALAYFTLAGIVSEGSIHITATGSYEKDNEFSRPISTADRARISNNYREKGLSVLKDAEKFLSVGKEDGDFELWRTGYNKSESPVSDPGISIAHRFKNRRNRRRYINGELCD